METRHSIGLSLVFALAGCAGSSQIPPERISSAQNAVRAAEQTRSTVAAAPDADHHLQLAREELTRAKDAENDGEDRRAELLYIRARSDAELAQALAMATKAEAEKTEALSELERAKSQPLPNAKLNTPTTQDTGEVKENTTKKSNQ